jgi:hypothetical protein
MEGGLAGARSRPVWGSRNLAGTVTASSANVPAPCTPSRACLATSHSSARRHRARHERAARPAARPAARARSFLGQPAVKVTPRTPPSRAMRGSQGRAPHPAAPPAARACPPPRRPAPPGAPPRAPGRPRASRSPPAPARAPQHAAAHADARRLRRLGSDSCDEAACTTPSDTAWLPLPRSATAARARCLSWKSGSNPTLCRVCRDAGSTWQHLVQHITVSLPRMLVC